MADQRRRPWPRKKYRFEVGAMVEPTLRMSGEHRYLPGEIIERIWTELGPSYLIQVGDQTWLAADNTVQRRLDG